MAPLSPVANGHDGKPRNNIKVLVTGFGPFQSQYPVNPSWEIAKSLPETVPSLQDGDSNIRIVCHTSPIRVAYKDAKALVPQILEANVDEVDLILHMGMAGGRQFYTAEQNGHRDGYISKHKDVDGLTPPEDEVEKYYPDCPPLMTTSLDFEKLVETWQQIISSAPPSSPAFGADCQPSENAGHYICDYTFFNSLVWYGRRNQRMSGGNATHRPVMFLHVPAESDRGKLETGRAVAVALIQAMADLYVKDLAVSTGTPSIR